MNKDNIFRVFVGLLSLFLINELVIAKYNLYYYLPQIDILSHFLAGFVISSFLYFLLYDTDFMNNTKYFLVLFISITISLLWELLEIAEDHLIYNPPYLIDYFIWDGFFDVIIASISTGIFLFIIYRLKKTECEDVMYY